MTPDSPAPLPRGNDMMDLHTISLEMTVLSGPAIGGGNSASSGAGGNFSCSMRIVSSLSGDSCSSVKARAASEKRPRFS